MVAAWPLHASQPALPDSAGCVGARAMPQVAQRHGCWLPHRDVQVMLLFTHAASAAPPFWTSGALQAAVPGALLHALHFQEPRALRLMLHHAFVPLVRSCPQAQMQTWLAEPVRHLMAFLPGCLSKLRAELQARVSGQLPDAQSTQTQDEIVHEVRSASQCRLPCLAHC